MEEEAVRRLVRRVVYRTLGLSKSDLPGAARLISEDIVRDMPNGGKLDLSSKDIVTPLARQIALEKRIKLNVTGGEPAITVMNQEPGKTQKKTVAIGADHGGFELKGTLVQAIKELGYAVVDCGTDSKSPVDYPDFAFAVASLVANGTAWRGIVIDGAGIGSCMAANKVPGVRAAMCYDQATAMNSREHNDANVLTLGAGMIGENLARLIVKTWLETPVGAERHVRRVEKIMQIERRYLKNNDPDKSG